MFPIIAIVRSCCCSSALSGHAAAKLPEKPNKVAPPHSVALRAESVLTAQTITSIIVAITVQVGACQPNVANWSFSTEAVSSVARPFELHRLPMSVMPHSSVAPRGHCGMLASAQWVDCVRNFAPVGPCRVLFLRRPMKVKTFTGTHRFAVDRQVNDWLAKSNVTVRKRPFGNAPFPIPAHRTGRADLRHPALRLVSP